MLSLSFSLFRLGIRGADHVTWWQTYALCKPVEALARLAIALGGRGAALTQVQAVQLASSLAVVWQRGRRLLEHRLNMARASRMLGNEMDENLYLRIVSCQSFAVRNMLTFLHFKAPPGAAASFARGFMRPGTVLPWLEAVAEVSNLVATSERESGEPPTCSTA
jgi:hypothetical protein